MSPCRPKNESPGPRQTQMVLCRACWIDQINHARNHTTNLLHDVVLSRRWTRCSVQCCSAEPGPTLAVRDNDGPRLCSTPRRKCGALPPGHETSELNRLARIGHRGRQAAIDRDRLSVDIGGVVACEKQSHRRQFMRLAGALQRVELADLAVGAALFGVVEDRFCHAGLD